ncbi:hypothetical protein [Burkholderia gladioli]|uniref:hypothetical protein n=1 Tax=Burkholderia gladioli TaxID=28095 RepID=UPI001360B603|nr:hypothetical protein [Burkholderia gladioli]MBW5288298.1 hypothetical protein [Burkholderia gladioli]
MSEKQDLRSRLVVGRKRDGRREYDDAARDELVQLCLQPGVLRISVNVISDFG